MDKQSVSNDSAALGNRLCDDLVWGVKGIAEEIGRTPRQAFHMVHTGQLPTMKIGGRIAASRARLREHFRALLDAVRT